jgi:hypothetical protein
MRENGSLTFWSGNRHKSEIRSERLLQFKGLVSDN